MQTITRILLLDGNNGRWTDDFGKTVSPPEIAVGVRLNLRLDLRIPERHPDTGKLLAPDPADVTSDSFYFVLDSDYLQSTDPKLIAYDLSLSSSEIEDEDKVGEPITTRRVYLDAVLPNTAVEPLLTVLSSAQAITLNGEIGGYSSQNSIADCDFITQFSMVIRNRIYLGNIVPEEVTSDPEYLTAAQVRALIAAATRPESASLTIGTVTSGNTASAEITGTSPDQVLNLVLKSGENGKTPYIGENGNWWIDGTDTEIKAVAEDGRPGDDGKTPYIGENGNWWIDGTDTGIPTRGPQGEDLVWDESGTVQERDAYADREAGFAYAATETDPNAGTTTLYIWKKRSDDWGDWTDPLIITYYAKDGKDGTNAALIEPIEFTAPTENQDYLYFNLSAHQAATIAAVCIDTDEGELRLPYYSAQGVRKIVRTSDGNVRIYFGTQVPPYSTGRIYFAQGVAYQIDIPDAPADGKIYARQYGQWVEVTAGSGPEDPGEDDPFDNLVDPGNYSDELLIVGG